MENYTGRKIAIFTDAHGLYEPTLAALQDMTEKGITEIYSLGDNIGVGPDSDKVIDLLNEYNVQSIAGNSEYYVSLGVEPFSDYFDYKKEMCHTWTLSKLNEKQKGIITLMPHYIDLMVGGKKLALCHFANDVRCDYDMHSTWTYQANLRNNEPAYEQFNYTNSPAQLKEIDWAINKFGAENPHMKGYLSAKQEPLFDRKKVEYYDAIIQGHVHFKLYENSGSTEYYTIRAVGMAYGNDPVDTASYVILNEKENGYDLEEILVKYNREQMICSVVNCTSPDKTIWKFINLTEEEYKSAKR